MQSLWWIIEFKRPYFDRLYFKDPITNNMISRLAERWEVADGGRSIMLYLNPDIRWHDGLKVHGQ